MLYQIEIIQRDIDFSQQAVIRPTVDFRRLELVAVVTNFDPAEEVEALAPIPTPNAAGTITGTNGISGTTGISGTFGITATHGVDANPPLTGLERSSGAAATSRHPCSGTSRAVSRTDRRDEDP